MEIRNIDLAKVIKFLESLKLKGIKSIERSKLTKYLSAELKEIVEGEQKIREDFKNDKKEGLKELKDYFEQTVVVKEERLLKAKKIIKNEIKKLTNEESEEEFSGDNAYALSILYEQLIDVGNKN